MTKRLLLLLVVVGCGISKPEDEADVALRPQPVTVVIPGLNQKAPGNVAALGTLRRAENVRIDKGQNGGLAFRRRNGLVQKATMANGSLGAFRMVSYQGSILASLADPAVGVPQRYIPGASPMVAIGDANSFNSLPTMRVAVSPLETAFKATSGAQTPTQSSLDMAIYQDTACYVWVDQDGIGRYLLRNGTTGATLAVGSFSGAASKSKIVLLGSTFYVFWKEANAIKATTINATTYAVAAASTVYAAGVLLAGTDYDIQTGFNATNIAILYRKAAGAYTRALLTTAFAVGATADDATAANQPDQALGWFSQPAPLTNGSLYYGTMNAASGGKLQTIDKATLAITATGTYGAAIANVDNMTGYWDGTVIRMLVDYRYTDGGGVTRHSVRQVFNGGASELDGASGIASRVFFTSPTTAPHPCVVFVYASAQLTGTVASPQPTYMVVTMGGQGLQEIARVLPLKAGPQTTLAISSVPTDSSGVWHFFGRRVVSAETDTGVLILQYGIVDAALEQNSDLIGGPIVSGGLAIWPGSDLFGTDQSPTAPMQALNFPLKPEIPVLTEGAAASGSVAPGAYSVLVRWKWIDSAGQVLRSATSTPVSITTVNVNSSIIVNYFPPMANVGRNYIHTEVLRTALGGAGDEYFKSTPAVYTGNVDGGNSGETYVDTLSDVQLQAGEPFAAFSATGGQLPPVAPPALNGVVEHRNRVCGINAEDPQRIECSNEYSPGTTYTWTGAIVLLAPEPVYGLASMDGHLVGFAKEKIFVWSGDLPDARGEGPTLPLYSLIPSGVGSDQPRSIVVTDMGVLFYSSKRGFHLLDRSLSVSYIGGAVETAASGQTISGATVHPTYPEVRFTSEGGTTFVLNTYWTRVAGTPIWTTFTGQACVHSITHNGKWYLLTSDGKLLEEDLTRWQDGSAVGSAEFTAGATFNRALEIADINFAGVNGFGRVYEGALLAEWFASEKIKITTTANHRRTDPSTGLPATDTPYTFDATVNPDPYVAPFRPAVQKVTSMTVLIEDTAEFQTQGAEWQALNFIVGVKGGAYRQSSGHYMAGGQRK